MDCTRRDFLALASAGTVIGLSACANSAVKDDSTSSSSSASDSSSSTASTVDLKEFEKLAINTSSWKYDEDNDVYYQLGLTYCLKPATETYESLAIFVPGNFFTAEKKGDSYSCTVNEKAVVGSFTPSTAPVLMPINTGSVAAQLSPTKYGYDGLKPYMEAGCIYVYPGFRGRSAGYDTSSGSNDLYPGGSPWPVVDFKAAIRFVRYNATALPCDASRVFAYGFAGGGGMSEVLGASGGSPLYEPYLDSIGAITHDVEGNDISDVIFGSASWCPLTSLDTIDASYEWVAGQYASTGTRADGTWTKQLSNGLANAYGEYVNAMDLRDSSDAQLALDESEGGYYTLGSYSSQLISILNGAAVSFLEGTTFPYTYTPQRLEDPSFPGDPNLASTRADEAAIAAATAQTQADAAADSSTSADSASAEATTPSTTTATGATIVASTIFGTVQDYFSTLNADDWWIDYNLSRDTVSISSLREFSTHVRPATLSVSAFDATDRSSKVNQLFGIGEESTLHFDQMDADLVKANANTYATCSDWDEAYATAWDDDLEKTDSLDVSIADRLNMFNPLYYTSGHYEGYGSAKVAAHWRINEGVFDSENSLCSSVNLALALGHCEGVADVAFTPVWGQGHVLAERTGTATTNLISWVTACCSA